MTGQDNDVLTGGRAVDGTLFNRVSSIVDRARKNVVMSVNNQMVLSYWLTGREIVGHCGKEMDEWNTGIRSFMIFLPG